MDQLKSTHKRKVSWKDMDMIRRIIAYVIVITLLRRIPGENDGQMTMKHHGLPWSTMVVHGHTSMVNHG